MSWDICLQHVLVTRNYHREEHISKLQKKIYWVTSGLYINQESVSKLFVLYLRVIRVCMDVVCIVDFVESGWKNIFSPL